jgi:ribulose-phosphate 3-epimerase
MTVRSIGGSPAHVSASIMCGRLDAIGKDLRALERAGIDSIHVDVMDGSFVPNLTFGPDMVAAMRQSTSMALHGHMMVEQPGTYVRAFADAGLDVYIFHIEATRYPLRLIEEVGEAGMVAGIAVNPSTPLTFLRDISAPYLLIMSVEPGFAGQRWIPSTVDRIRRARDLVGDAVVIGVDGNVSTEKIPIASDAGASLFVCGRPPRRAGRRRHPGLGDTRRLRLARLSAGAIGTSSVRLECRSIRAYLARLGVSPRGKTAASR